MLAGHLLGNCDVIEVLFVVGHARYGSAIQWKKKEAQLVERVDRKRSRRLAHDPALAEPNKLFAPLVLLASIVKKKKENGPTRPEGTVDGL